MTLKFISSTALVITAVTLLVVLAFHVRAGATANAVAVLKTTGMTCSSCSSAITKALKRESGVAVTEVDVAGGLVIVGYDTQRTKPETLAQKVSDAGFSSNIYAVLTPEEFKQATGREIGRSASATTGCCGVNKGGCTNNRQNLAQGE
ncbi:heavy-metal-associated domain-containing protein [Geobacter pelophilus]|uniref:Heavy-metal-associated domain-containing protein n=1 Tax=Geoanaerobacter pelophilus TaxID=60036 RepID=A0AAW4L3S9_9BACT|nr:heavy-metal-associated domain-containing protein [Geoanaerobacter pelophilus]MBT0663623.1 heavy-metal-associated domain-containing protein [Geoanaerobacter pelophilus]